ncbi:MAG: hypothetical protein ACSHWU_10025 [Marinicella sp.]
MVNPCVKFKVDSAQVNSMLNNANHSYRRKKTVQALSLILPLSIPQILNSETADFTLQPVKINHRGVGDYVVNQTEDDGTGLVSNTLSWAILQANTEPGHQVIILENDIKMTGVMKRLIDSDLEIKSAGSIVAIDGDNQYRPLFIKSGQVDLSRLNLINGKAEGSKPGYYGSGGGAGMGGSLFIYSGDVSLDQVNISDSTASSADTFVVGFGGGGMFYTGERGRGGAGLFTEYVANSGAYGGYGNYQNIDSQFGQGGDYGYGFGGGDGGFGAGGGFDYTYETGHALGGDGGFGGGAGGATTYYSSFTIGRGGFGGGSGKFPGYGATNYGAAMGGAVFMRSGNLTMRNVNLVDNTAIANLDSKGLGGAIFILHSTSNTNGNDQGMPAQLPVVTGCNMLFNNNSANSDPGLPLNNDDIFDLAGLYIDLGDCEADLIFKTSFE